MREEVGGAVPARAAATCAGAVPLLGSGAAGGRDAAGGGGMTGGGKRRPRGAAGPAGEQVTVSGRARGGGWGDSACHRA